MTAFNPTDVSVTRGDILERVRNGTIWLMFAVSFFVYVEPAPVDLMFILVLVMFLPSGLSVTIGAAPLAMFLILYNLGGFMSFIRVSTEPKSLPFIATSTYMAVTGIIIAYYVAHDPMRRFVVVKNAWIVGAFIAAVLALAQYFHLTTLIREPVIVGRATGTFKDPNVFSTFLIFPAIALIQGLMFGTAKYRAFSVAAILTITLALFLSFSRGAWINFVGAVSLFVVLTFILNTDTSMRRRIILFAVAAFAIAAVAFAIMMSITEIREMFFMRFALIQSYDSGETGRFGNQVNSVPLLLNLPLGFGPLAFRTVFREDPHNTFLNAFASYGWLGGITYFTMIISTLIIGIKAVFTRTPWQNYAVAVFCPLVTTILQGVQIDTEHWRHFYWMLGLTWGLFAATMQPAAVVGGWAALGLQQPSARRLASA